jgi:hypothetical protein
MTGIVSHTSLTAADAFGLAKNKFSDGGNGELILETVEGNIPLYVDSESLGGIIPLSEEPRWTRGKMAPHLP